MPFGFTSKEKAKEKVDALIVEIGKKQQEKVDALIVQIGKKQTELTTCIEELSTTKSKLANFHRVPGSVKVLPGGDIHRPPSEEELEQKEQKAEIDRQIEQRRVAREAELRGPVVEQVATVAPVAPVVSTLAEQLSQVRLKKTGRLPQSGGKKRSNKKRSGSQKKRGGGCNKCGKKRSNKKRSNKKRSNRRR
jgi:hypothetical protein